MKKGLIYCLLILYCCFVNAQQASTAEEMSGMRAQFSMKVIDAYQKSSQSKVKDFFQYAALLSDNSLSDELKLQIEQNINSLFISKEVNIIDFTSTERKIIALDKFLLRLKEEKNVRFIILNETKSKTTFSDYWMNSYDVLVTKGTISETISVHHKIYFSPMEKQFGSSSKEVWNILLGEIE